MAQDKFWGVLSGLILFVLFTSLILTIAIDFGADNGREASEIGGGSFNLSMFENSIENISDTGENYRSRFESGDVDDVDDPSGLFSVVTDMVEMITTPFKLLGQVIENVLKIPEFFADVILGLLAILLILAIWSLLRKGD